METLACHDNLPSKLTHRFDLWIPAFSRLPDCSDISIRFRVVSQRISSSTRQQTLKHSRSERVVKHRQAFVNSLNVEQLGKKIRLTKDVWGRPSRTALGFPFWIDRDTVQWRCLILNI